MDYYINKKSNLQENYTNLDEERKEQILKELQKEMENMKVKYMLKDKNKTRGFSKIEELSTFTNRQQDDSPRPRPQAEARYDHSEDYFLPNECNFDKEENFQEENSIIYDNDKEISCENNVEDKIFEYKLNKENMSDFISSKKLKASNRSKATINSEMFDKAKENLMKIRNDLDEMDQYDHKNKNISYIQKEDDDIDIEEEQPKNLEHEMSISKSLKDESVISNNPYISEINNFHKNYNFIQIQPICERENELKRNKKNYMPRTMESEGYSNLNMKNSSNSLTNSIRNNAANDVYFKKIIPAKEFKPYIREKSKERLEKIKSEVQEKFNRDHPFKPKIKLINSDCKYETSEDKYKRLSTPKSVEINKRLKKKELDDRIKLNEECTFKPYIGKEERENSNNQGHNRDREKVESRLYKLAEQLKEKREKLKREFQENSIKEFSFNPKIDENSKQLILKYENKPLHERYEEIIKNKKKNIQNLRIMSEKSESVSFTPDINSKSKEIILRKTDRSFNGELGAHERLYREGIDNKNKRTKNLPEPELDECTFSPNLYFSLNKAGGNIDDFLERQKIYDEIKKERLEKKLSKSIENNQYTFTPKINITSDILMMADHNRAGEDMKSKVDRLYKDDFEKLKNRKDQLEKCYYAQYDFKPKINEISRFVGKDHSVEDLHFQKESYKIRKIRNEKQKHETDDCTFKPTINKDKYSNVKSNYVVDENISQRIQNEVKCKNEKINEIKNFIEESQLKECKFHPDINKDLPNYDTKDPIIIKGFSKYLDQMEKARKAKREKEEREKEVFVTGENWSRDNLITIPKPFNLSHQKLKSDRREILINKNKQLEMKECTFKPNTNESKNKEIIKLILNN